MAAMLPSGAGGSSQSANPYEHYDEPITADDDLIDPDDGMLVAKDPNAHLDTDANTLATLDELDDPIHGTSDRAPLVSGNITSQQANQNTRSAQNAQGFLNSAISGEDRRAPMNTIDESVWDTLRRDLLAVWEKMKQVLYPKYLLGGMMARGGGMNEEAGPGGIGNLRNLVGRWPDADVVLQSGMSEGLRDWDLWGPLLFCLLLSTLLSFNARADQASLVFSGVFATVWLGEAIVTLQIKLLGGNISFFQSVCIIGYTLFPIVIAALLSALKVPTIVRIPVYIVLGLWALAAGVSILGGSGVVKNRVVLAMYPLFVFYVGLICLCFLS